MNPTEILIGPSVVVTHGWELDTTALGVYTAFVSRFHNILTDQSLSVGA